MNSLKLFDHEAERRFLAAVCDLGSVQGPGEVRLALERERLTPEDFHLPAHAAVFGAVVRILAAGGVVEPVALADALRGDEAVQKAGGFGWVASLLMHPEAILTAVPGYASTLRDLSLRRRIVLATRRALEAATDFSRPPAEVLGTASAELAALVRRGDEPRTLLDVLQEIQEELEAVAMGTKQPVLPTGIEVLDSVIGGLQPTLTILGALPGVGKSAFLATVARNLAEGGTKVGFFSLEDQASWIGWRLLSDATDINQFILRHRRLSDAHMDRVGFGFGRLIPFSGNLMLDDRSGLTPLEVANTARDLVVNRGAKAIFVDHLGELRYGGKHKDRFDLEIAEGLSELRAIAKEYEVPVVCATHLRRGVEERTDGEVRLTDFANSSAIERQARVALGLSRQPGSGRLTVWVLKQTNGKAGVKVHLDFHGAAALVRTTGGEVEGDEEAA